MEADIVSSVLSAVLGAGSGGATAAAVLFTRLAEADRRIKALEDRHEANAARIASVETTQAATGATMAAMTSSMARIEATLERLSDRLNAFPNEVAVMLGGLDNRPRRQ